MVTALMFADRHSDREPVQVRNSDGAGVDTSEGAFLRSHLPIAGFAIIEAATLEEAVGLVSKTPCAVVHGVVEVWPLSDAVVFRAPHDRKAIMATPYTLKKLTDIEDAAPKSGFGDVQEARFAKDALDTEDTGFSYHRIKRETPPPARGRAQRARGRGE